MCLRFVFLLITRTASWLRLSQHQETWRIAEILILRHQLAVLQRRQPCRPKLNWADRALLAILLGAIPKARRQGLRLLVTPDTMLRWHRDIVRRRWAARSMRGKTGADGSDSRSGCGREARGGIRRSSVQILHQYETHHNQHRPHRSLHSAAPLKPLPQPVVLGQYRVRRQTRAGGTINEYRLVARCG